MLKYKTDRTGLVAFYDIQSGNAASLFLQPQTRTGLTHTQRLQFKWPIFNELRQVLHRCSLPR